MAKRKEKTKQVNKNRPKTRKETRKEKRKLKKQRRLEYYTNRKKPGRFALRPADDKEQMDSINKVIGKQKINRPPNDNNKKQPTKSAEDTYDIMEREKRKQLKLQKEMQKQRGKQLLQANLEEDRNIKHLAKQLKLNKRKSKTIPKCFVEDGLDYLLEVCDSENMKDAITAEQQLNEANGEFEEDFALMTDQPIEKSSKKRKSSSDKHKGRKLHEDGNEADDINDSQSNEEKRCKTDVSEDDMELDEDIASENDEDIASENDEETASENDDDDGIASENDDDESISNDSDGSSFVEDDIVLDGDASDVDESNSDANSETKKRKLPQSETAKKVQKSASDDKSNSGEKRNSDTWEDIYGRTRGKDGSIISDNTRKYIPPALRAKMENSDSNDAKRQEKLNRLKKQLKGLLNRLAVANMHSIATQIEELYMNNSRNDMNETITNLMLESLISNGTAPEHLLIEHVFLITILHANIGTEVGAHFLQVIVKQFNALFNTEQEVENKALDNIVAILAQLYNFKIFHSQLLYQILSKLSSKFNEKCVECILSVLKNVGFSLRKDDPLALKSLILELQKQALEVPDEVKDNARTKYMLDILLAIKNNNTLKIPNYGTGHAEQLKKLQKNYIRKGNYVTQLNISLNDLLQAEERGKWWIVGSAWSGAKEEDNPENKNKIIPTEEFSKKLLKAAKAQRMNTDTRKNIFCTIMSAEDYIDAFTKLLQLNLKKQEEREIIHVLLHCCLQEKDFNPYYAVLAQKFCEYDRRYMMAIKFSIWDKVKTLTDCSASQISSLAKLLTHLFLKKALSISTLKILQFNELDKVMVRFTRQILIGILLYEDTDMCMGVFENVALSDKLKKFREALRLFIRHFLIENLEKNNVPENQKNLLNTRVDMVDRMLTLNVWRREFE